MHEPVWRWGVLDLPFSSLTFFAAVVIGLVMTYIEGRRKLLPESRLIDFLLLALVGGIAGGRVIYAAFFDSAYYFKQPLRLFHLQDCGFSFWGGLGCALVVILIWAYRENLIVERYLDAAAPALAFCLSCGYIGSQLRGGAMNTPFPWAVFAGGAHHHPDGAYAIILFMIVYFLLKRRRPEAVYEGELFIWFLLGCSVINILTDFIRELPRVWEIFTAGQLFSAVVAAFALFFITAGPRIPMPSSYLRRTVYRRKSAETAAFLMWHLILTAGMVLAYYWIHRLPIIR